MGNKVEKIREAILGSLLDLSVPKEVMDYKEKGSHILRHINEINVNKGKEDSKELSLV